MRLARPDLFPLGYCADRLRRSVPAGVDEDDARLAHAAAALDATALLLAEDALTPDPRAIRERSWVVEGAASEWEFSLPEGCDLAAVSVDITNVGSTDLVDPRLTVNGHGDWFDRASIAAAAVGDATTERDRAQRLWEFVVRSRQHAPPPDTSGARVTRDPVQMLNSYGYGLCGDSAWLLHGLAQEVGLASRVWYLKGHVVPELRVDGDWRLLDPDAGTVYPLRDGSGWASVEDLAIDPTLYDEPLLAPSQAHPLYSEAASQKVRAAYVSTEDNRVFVEDGAAVPATRMSWTLRPGEGLERSWGHLGRRVTGERLDVPGTFANGTWRYTLPAFEAGHGAATPFRSPYPIVDGRVILDLDDASTRADWRGAVVLATGEEVSLGWVGSGTSGSGRVALPLSGALANGLLPAEHSLQVLIEPRSPTSTAVPDGVTCELIVQLAPRSLPALVCGRNVIRWRCGSPDAEARITFRYRSDG
jgi:hypothetical protein